MQGVFAQIAFNGASRKCPLTSAGFGHVTAVVIWETVQVPRTIQYVLLLWHLCICARVKSHAT